MKFVATIFLLLFQKFFEIFGIFKSFGNLKKKVSSPKKFSPPKNFGKKEEKSWRINLSKPNLLLAQPMSYVAKYSQVINQKALSKNTNLIQNFPSE